MSMFKSSDLVLLFSGLILSIIFAFAFDFILSLDQINLIFALLLILTLFVLGIAWIFNKKLKENEEFLSEQRVEQKRLGEKLKIHEQLIDIKKDIEMLKERGRK